MFPRMSTSAVITLIVAAIVLLTGSASQARGQDIQTPNSVEFTLYEGNPVLPKGSEGAWDAGFTAKASVLLVDGFSICFLSGEMVFTT